MSSFRRQHHGKESWGITPLTDLGTSLYKGQQGGLYPGGQNVPPRGHLESGLRIARTIVPLNAEGNPDPDGKIVLISVGYSNWTMEFSVFAPQAMADPERNPRTLVLDCAVGGQTTAMSAHPEAEYYKVVDKRLHDAGVTLAQVQIVMLKVATHLPSLPFPWEVNYLRDQEVKTLHVLKERFPNLKLLYATSRIYEGLRRHGAEPRAARFRNRLRCEVAHRRSDRRQAGAELRSEERRSPPPGSEGVPIFGPMG